MLAGIKKVEIRLLNEKSSKLKIGDNIKFSVVDDENTYLKFGIYRKNEHYEIAVFEKIDEDEHIAFSKDITSDIETRVSDSSVFLNLEIDTDYLKRSFTFGFSDSEMEKLGTLENVYYLCDEGIHKGKRFTGAMIGVYAYAGETDCKVSFKNFNYIFL